MSRLVKRVNYEWAFETFDLDSEDILDIWHFDMSSYERTSQVMKDITCTDDHGYRLVLVRDVYEGLSDEFNYSADLIDRSWAYVEDGKLPEFTDSGEKVPQKFHKQLEQAK